MTPRQLWRHVADAIARELRATTHPWHESGYLYDRWPDPEADPRVHLSYAVGVPQSTSVMGRQRDCLPMQSTVVVAFAVGLAADNEVGSYGAALDREHEMVRAVKSVPCVITSITRRLMEDTDGAWAICEIRATIDHEIPL